MKIENLPFEEKLKEEMADSCSSMQTEKDTTLAEAGKFLKAIPLVLEGSIRVFRNDYDIDREILLYYISEGETCMMSIIASFTDMQSKVHAITECESKLLVIPIENVRKWQVKYPKWNNFILNIFLNRYTELLNTINDLSFKNIDERLFNYLVQYYHRHPGECIKITHQKLANELGTTRVVISRLLKDFEKNGKVELYRGEIKLLKSSKLTSSI